ncbi:hypothetical protein PVAP13_3KG125403, partial [Panicum virgatum]
MQSIRFTDSEHKNGSNGKMHSGNFFVQLIWVRLIGHPEYLSVLELDIQTKNFQALGRIPELSSAGFLQLAQHIEFVQNFCILI